MISLEEMSPILTINSVNVESDIAIAQFRFQLFFFLCQEKLF